MYLVPFVEPGDSVRGLRKIGIDHAYALLIPAASMAEVEDQVEWFTKTVL
jgi:hypothetical protein